MRHKSLLSAIHQHYICMCMARSKLVRQSFNVHHCCEPVPLVIQYMQHVQFRGNSENSIKKSLSVDC